MKKLILPMALACSAFTAPVFADHSQHALKHHTVGAFVGYTNAESTENSYGLEYEYRINSQWGAGAVWEKTPDGHASHHGHHVQTEDVSVYLAAGYWHHDALRLGLGFGKEKVHGEHGHTESLIRATAAYDFHLNHSMGIAPVVSVDKVDGEYIQVYGISLNYMF